MIDNRKEYWARTRIMMLDIEAEQLAREKKVAECKRKAAAERRAEDERRRKEAEDRRRREQAQAEAEDRRRREPEMENPHYGLFGYAREGPPSLDEIMDAGRERSKRHAQPLADSGLTWKPNKRKRRKGRRRKGK